MKELHKILTRIQDQIGGDVPCQMTVQIDRAGDLRFTAAWDDWDWCVKHTVTKEQIKFAKSPDCLVNLFVILVRESEQYKGRREDAG
jgi:hypothetical protein